MDRASAAVARPVTFVTGSKCFFETARAVVKWKLSQFTPAGAAANIKGLTIMQSTLLLALVAGALAAGAAAAQTAAPADKDNRSARMQQRAADHFAKLDKNGDGLVSREEATGNKRLEQNFEQADANKDGKLSKDEIHARRPQAGPARHKTRFEEHFKAADKDGDGALTKAEAATAPIPGIVKHFDHVDANKDGKLTQDEMLAAHATMRGKRAERHADRFKAADKDGDGALTKAEAESKPRLARRFDVLDQNQDGKVTPEELKAAKGPRG